MRVISPKAWPVSLFLSAVFVAALAAQTTITAPKNKYSPADDVQAGREAAAQVEKELPILRDETVTAYVDTIGRRILSATPSKYRHAEFRYTFKVVDAKEINAFALPGGPTYFNSGMIIAAGNEAQVAGVMAHEISHVLLRHGTAQATKATPYALGQLAGAILGAIVGGKKGELITEGTQLGIGAAFLRFPREYEKQADLLGAQLMARAGYDPREMANMFRTIAASSGSGGPEWLSDHPDPGNRYEYVMEEAARLRVRHPVAATADFQAIRQRLMGRD
jgi:predicted Zn-dependent protease